MAAATVPFLGEYLNICISYRLSSVRYLTVSANSSSVSPGKPTITSVVSAGDLYAFLSMSHFSKYCLQVYFLFILLSTESQPLCRLRWKCGHTFELDEILSTNSSVIIPGSSEPSLILLIPLIFEIASISSISAPSLFLSLPYDDMCIPVSTTSFIPASASSDTSARIASWLLLLILPLTYGIMQYEQN